ncbi:hypothetical protein BDV23DRAFT_118407 [Aspergillus alliaceus]|uniref:Uncharacterized protein n=1 Tax=Petromyces alliaceus TaxID=209559 RepID=A0A5N7C2B9_PETAA|nr:hypothetical protein BDV23DRAFT_118407 [Aspergillus alliaceus]
MNVKKTINSFGAQNQALASFVFHRQLNFFFLNFFCSFLFFFTHCLIRLRYKENWNLANTGNSAANPSTSRRRLMIYTGYKLRHLGSSCCVAGIRRKPLSEHQLLGKTIQNSLGIKGKPMERVCTC